MGFSFVLGRGRIIIEIKLKVKNGILQKDCLSSLEQSPGHLELRDTVSSLYAVCSRSSLLEHASLLCMTSSFSPSSLRRDSASLPATSSTNLSSRDFLACSTRQCTIALGMVALSWLHTTPRYAETWLAICFRWRSSEVPPSPALIPLPDMVSRLASFSSWTLRISLKNSAVRYEASMSTIVTTMALASSLILSSARPDWDNISALSSE
mmetsp:Transcript_1628/g.5131  ORF Transcript_1628/g.5131 Transcript_1628/m.5131 type:complete len:209 (-) Transcript_1628:190-816(-)